MKNLGQVNNDYDVIYQKYANEHYLPMKETMPSVSSEWDGKVVQYIGDDETTYKKGQIYKCDNSSYYTVLWMEGLGEEKTNYSKTKPSGFSDRVELYTDTACTVSANLWADLISVYSSSSESTISGYLNSYTETKTGWVPISMLGNVSFVDSISTAPPSSSYQGKTIMYDGATSGIWVKGHFYQYKQGSYWKHICTISMLEDTQTYYTRTALTSTTQTLYTDTDCSTSSGYVADTTTVYVDDTFQLESGTVDSSTEITGADQWVDITSGSSGSYLPLTGGTLSGDLGFSNIGNIKMSGDTSSIRVYGGSTQATGACFILHGSDYPDSNWAGAFSVETADGPKLVGKLDGTLTWNDKNIAVGSFLPLTGGTMAGAIAMGSKKITGLATPTADTDASNKSYVDTKCNDYLPLAGGTMTGAIKPKMGANGFVVGQNDTDYVQICGGTASTSGGAIWMNGMSRSTNPGSVNLRAHDGTNNASMRLDPDGLMSWNYGRIISDVSNTSIYRSADTGRTNIYSATSWDAGGYLELYSKNFTAISGRAGQFRLSSHDGTNTTALIGTPEGDLTWGGNPVCVQKTVTLTKTYSTGFSDNTTSSAGTTRAVKISDNLYFIQLAVVSANALSTGTSYEIFAPGKFLIDGLTPKYIAGTWVVNANLSPHTFWINYQGKVYVRPQSSIVASSVLDYTGLVYCS